MKFPKLGRLYQNLNTCIINVIILVAVRLSSMRSITVTVSTFAENKCIIEMWAEHKANIILVEVILFIGFETFGSSKMLKVWCVSFVLNVTGRNFCLAYKCRKYFSIRSKRCPGQQILLADSVLHIKTRSLDSNFLLHRYQTKAEAPCQEELLLTIRLSVGAAFQWRVVRYSYLSEELCLSLSLSTRLQE